MNAAVGPHGVHRFGDGETVGSTLDTLRSVDLRDRPIKIHAYGHSPWGWDTVASHGGYSHHTGSGPGWNGPSPSNRPGSSACKIVPSRAAPSRRLREFRGIWGSLIFMGKNAHDYFLGVHDITGDPAKRAYFEAKAPAIKVMGRANVLVSPVAAIREQSRYRGEFGRWETCATASRRAGRRNGPALERSDAPQGRISTGSARSSTKGSPAGTTTWPRRCEGYVRRGGILVLDSLSGIHTYIEREQGAGPRAGRRPAWPGSAKGGQFAVKYHRPPARRPVRGTSAAKAATARRPPRWSRLRAPKCWASGPTAPPAAHVAALGRGFVYLLANNVYPAELIAGLATAHGLGTYASAEGGFDLLRTLRSNNGTEDLLMVRGKERQGSDDPMDARISARSGSTIR